MKAVLYYVAGQYPGEFNFFYRWLFRQSYGKRISPYGLQHTGHKYVSEIHT